MSLNMPVAVRNIDHSMLPLAPEFAKLGVATIHEAQGRKGLLDHRLRPIYRPVSIAGTAVTCEVAPGDNWSIHVAIELCSEGDILVVSPTSDSLDGYFGDLLATSLQARGVQGLVIDAGVRDIATLTEMKFPVWSAAVCAQGTVKETLGDVNRPIDCAGQRIDPGDLIACDDDGVVVVRRAEAETVIQSTRDRIAKEEKIRAQLEAGASTLDLLNIREGLANSGMRYVDSESDLDSNG